MMLQQRQCAASSSRPAGAHAHAAAAPPPRPRAVAVAAAASRSRFGSSRPSSPSSPSTSSTSSLAVLTRRQLHQQQQQQQHPQLHLCRGFGGGGNRGPSSSGPAPTNLFSPVYLAIFAGYAALLLLHNPYIYAGLTIAAVLPQNSAVTSLNNLVLLFYESGLFANFAEAVYCVRLVTWLSIGFMLGSFALFN